MPVKVIVNPDDPKGENITVIEDEYQAIIPIRLEYSDGYVGRMIIYCHGERINDRMVAKAITVNTIDPELMR